MNRVRQLAVVFAAALVLCGASGAAAPTRTEPIVVHVDKGGFRIADALVGALACLGAVAAAAGGRALVRLRRADIESRKEARP